MSMRSVLGFLLIVGGIFGAVLLIYSLLRYLKDPKAQFSSKAAAQAAANAEAYSEEDQAASTYSVQTRLKALGLVCAGVLSALALKLWSMQILGKQEFEELAENNRTRQIPTKAPRGRILDRNGEIIVSNRAALAVLADREALRDSLLIKRLANVLGMPYEVVRRNIQDESQGASAKRLVALDVPMSSVAYIVEHPNQFEHISIESRSVRAYPHGKLAAHLLGYTGTISQEELKRNKEEEDPRIVYEMGDVVGKTGIEYQYEQVLQGVSGSHIVQVDAHGQVVNYVEDIPAIPGNDIQLTIDIKFQEICERYLAEAIKIAQDTGRKNAHAGAAAIMEVKTGKVLAMASYPSFDPMLFVGGIGSETWENLTSEDSHNPLANRVIAGQYPMASTIKPFSALCALDNGISTPESSYMCTGRWKGFGEKWAKWCWLHSGHGPQNIRQGIVNSCDTVFYEIGKAFVNSDKPEALQETYRLWGLGSKTGVDLPGEAAGRIPDAEWKYNYFTKAAEQDRRWVPGDTVNMVIGQGDVLVTPLQVLRSYCGLANGGTVPVPRLLDKVLSQNSSEVVLEAESTFSDRIDCNPEYLDLILSGLRGVVAESSIRIYYRSMKTPLAGKTGTAEVAGKGDYAWFVGYGPFEDPEYACVLIVEQGGGGGTAAAPAVRQIFGDIYGEPMPEIQVKEDRTR